MQIDSRLTARALAGPAVLDHVHGLLDTLFARSDLPDEDAMLSRLAVAEVATNIIEHARADHPITVEVEVGIRSGSLVARLGDDADPLQIDLETRPMPAADAEAGRGLPIAQAALSHLEHHVGTRGNMWSLQRDLPAQADSGPQVGDL